MAYAQGVHGVVQAFHQSPYVQFVGRNTHGEVIRLDTTDYAVLADNRLKVVGGGL